jgi:hypothetical protein
MTAVDREQANRIALANIDKATRESLMATEAKYRNEMQASQSAASFYTQITQNIAAIETNKDLNAAAKQTAIANQLARLNEGMGVFEAIAGMDVGTLLNGGTIGTPPPSTGGTTPNNPAPSVTEDSFAFPGVLPSMRSMLVTQYENYTGRGGRLAPYDWYQQFGRASIENNG